MNKENKLHKKAKEYMANFKANNLVADPTDYEHLEKEILADPIAFEAFKRNRNNREKK